MSSTAAMTSETAPGRAGRVRLNRSGLVLQGGDLVPLRTGAMHYFRNAPADWGRGLDALVSMGLKLVDVYVPWGHHERERGVFDFGEKNRRLDVARFLSMAADRGLLVILRPGPHINAELTRFGLPERVVWDPACQARTPQGHPVMLPVPPLAFPVPSYASRVFHEETARWFEAMARVLAPLCYPAGPIVLVQVDNEGALYFRDGPYDQDYHPDAIALYREFLAAKYGRADAYEPPQRFDAESADGLARHLDWMEFHEHLLARGMDRFAASLRSVGFDGVPTMHNFPLGEVATALNAARMTRAIDLVALDYYHRATPAEHMTILRRTTDLATRCDGADVPAYGAEMGAGYPPFFAPIDVADSLYTLLAAIAYGLRGYSLYMAVERDRWIGSPVDSQGRRRPLADAYEALSKALEETKLLELTRRAPVRLVMPRSLRRLARATHAFGPLTPALFNILGAGFRESCLEEPLGFETAPALAGEMYIRAFERSFTSRGVPYAWVSGENLETGLVGAEWVVCVLSGGVKPRVLEQLRAARARGAAVTIGPSVPDRDGSLRRVDVPLDVRDLEVEPLDDATRADALVAARIEQLSLPTFAVSPDDAFLAVHEDREGRPRVAFAMNPSAADVVARVAIPKALSLRDVLPLRRFVGRAGALEARIARVSGSFEVPIDARSVRMFAVER